MFVLPLLGSDAHTQRAPLTAQAYLIDIRVFLIQQSVQLLLGHSVSIATLTHVAVLTVLLTTVALLLLHSGVPACMRVLQLSPHYVGP